MKIGKTVCVFMALLCNLVPVVAYAGDIYKWTDDEGTVHYGERAPSNGAKVTKIRSAPKSSQDGESVSPSRKADPRIQRDKMIQALQGDRLAREEKKQKQKEINNKLKMQCAQVKDTLRRYKNSNSLYKLDADGKRYALPESEKQQEIIRMLDEMKKHCK